jgi:hypothetical protein
MTARISTGNLMNYYRGSVIAFMTSVVMLACACNTYHDVEMATPRTADVVGTWVASDGGKLDFGNDGHFVATKAKRLLTLVTSHVGTNDHGSGEWEVGASGQMSSIQLLFRSIDDTPQSYATEILAYRGNNHQIILFMYLHDPDVDTSKYEYVKQ